MQRTFKSLTKAEEQVMQVLWKLEKAFVKDIIDAMPEPKPHYNTVSTILKILSDKGFTDHVPLGKSNHYFPLIDKETYSKGSMKQFVKRYFKGSFTEMVSFFVKEKDLSVEQLEDLLKELKKPGKK